MAHGQPAPNLKARREAANLSPDALAKRAGLSVAAVIRAEHVAATRPGATVLNAADMARLAAALSTTVSDIRGF